MGAEWESAILSQRLDILESFKNEYIRIQQEMLAAQNAIVEVEDGYSDFIGNLNRPTLTLPPGFVVKNPNGTYSASTKYASGTKHSRQGISNVDEIASELIIGPSKGRYTYLEAGSQVMTANLASNLFTMAQNPIKWLKENLSKLPLPNAQKLSANYSTSIGDIVINNPVGNVSDLANEINNTLSSRGYQLVIGKA